MSATSVLVHQSNSSPSPTLSTVCVIDDDVSVRESLEQLIRSAGWAVQTYASAEEFLAREQAVTPGCLILDISLPGLNGLELQKRLGSGATNVPIIFITGYGNVPMTVRAMKAGAVEFLTKPFSDRVLMSAIQEAFELSCAVCAYETDIRPLRDRYASLSRRERDVLLLVVAGWLNKRVGAELGISEITVKAHRGRLMRKMQATSFADLVQMAVKLDLLQAGSGLVRSPAAPRNNPIDSRHLPACGIRDPSTF
jgi:FixJ family two-component response regulator